MVVLAFNHPRKVLVAWALLAVIGSVGVSRLRIETSTDSVLDRADPAWSFYQESQERFGGDEILTVLVEAAQPLDRAALDEVVRLTAAFEQLDGIARVDSLATVPLVHVTPGGDVSLEAALEQGVPASAAGLTSLAELIERDRIALRNLISPDGRSVAVNLVLERGAERHYARILERIKEEVRHPITWVSGVPIFRTETDSRTRRELAMFVPLTGFIIGGLLFGLFGSVRAVLIPQVASGLGMWLMLGAMGALSIPLTISTVLLPSILLALGAAYCMHLLTAAVGNRSEVDVLESLLRTALPVALSGLTTAIGFIAVSSVRIEAIRQVGAFGALGVVGVLVASLTVVPAALRLWPMGDRRVRFQHALSKSAPVWITMLGMRHRWALITAWAAGLAVVGVGIERIVVETDVVVWFSREDPIRVAYNAIRERLSGISPMNVVIEAPPGGSVATPEVVLAINGLTEHLETLDSVGRAISIADPLRQIHGGFLGDGRNPIPEGLDLISQYLLLLESKEYTGDLITNDRSAANVRLRLDNNGSKALLDVARAAEEWWERNGAEGYLARTTGIMFEFARAEDAITQGQIRGLGFALLAIGLILVAIFRWVRLAAIALVPNAVPVVMAFGLMGLMGVPLDAGTVVLGNLALGIAVDDTIHVVEGFWEKQGEGIPPQRALVATLERVLPAIVFTSLAVALGFAVLGISGFTMTRHLGLLTAGVMVLCLLADLLLLPALLFSMSGRHKPVQPRMSETGEAGRRIPD